MVKNWRKPAAQQPAPQPDRVAKSIGESLERPGADLIFGTADGLRDTVLLRLTDVEPNPNQPRRHFDEEELQALSFSLREVGQLSPILVQAHPTEPKRFLLVAGERRWRAAGMAGLTKIMAHILPTDANTDQIALIENLQRVDLSPVEEAEGIRRLIETHEYNQEAVGDLLGRSRTEVNTTLTLLKLEPTILKECVTSHNDVPKAVLLELARMEEIDQLSLWLKVKKDGLTAREAREYRAKLQRPPEPAKGSAAAKPVTAKKFIAGLGKLEESLSAGIEAVEEKGTAKLKPEEKARLEALKSRLTAMAARLDGLLGA
ncbi:ParB/RepB/Spo0J family partition protein [Niveispirillum sp. KHB5.9]|uniref:ParB/RepB/Spo0J family partition protein n=1 Tax=Niveispirillum sp. KHB5.9 TaxID=3400269 RepID=UPI003A8A9A4B